MHTVSHTHTYKYTYMNRMEKKRYRESVNWNWEDYADVRYEHLMMKNEVFDLTQHI